MAVQLLAVLAPLLIFLALASALGRGELVEGQESEKNLGEDHHLEQQQH
jgi:hypothetical protein